MHLQVVLPGNVISNCLGTQCAFNSSTILRPANVHMLAWKVYEFDRHRIPEHWLSYPEPEPRLHYLLASLYTFFTFFALSGNGIIIWIFCSTKQLRSTSNAFVVNLAVADFLMMAKCPIFIYNSYYTGYELGHLYCQIYASVGSMAGIGQAMSNLCIAYDRYRSIAHPMAGPISKCNAFFMVLFTWVWATPWTLMPIFEYWGRFVPEGYLTSCTFDYLTTTMNNRLFVFFLCIFAYFIPLITIMLLYAQIVGYVVNQEKALKAQAKRMNVDALRWSDAAKISSELRICKTAIGICSLFVASWTPYTIVALIGAFGNQALLTPTVTMIPALTCKLVACVDPYVYVISHPRFRYELHLRFPHRFYEPEPDPNDFPGPTSGDAAEAGETATTLI